MKKTLLYILFLFTLTDLGAQYLSHPSHEAAFWATIYSYKGEKTPLNYEDIVFLNKILPKLDSAGRLSHIQFSDLMSLSILFHFKYSKGMEIWDGEKLLAYIPAKTFKKAYSAGIKEAEIKYLKEVLKEKAKRRVTQLYRAAGRKITDLELDLVGIQSDGLGGLHDKEIMEQYRELIQRFHDNIDPSELNEKRKQSLQKSLERTSEDILSAKNLLKSSRKNHVDYLKGKKKKHHLFNAKYTPKIEIALTQPANLQHGEDFSGLRFVFLKRKFENLEAHLFPIIANHKPQYRVLGNYICEPFERILRRPNLPPRHLASLVRPIEPKLQPVRRTFKSRLVFERGKAEVADTILYQVKQMQQDSNYLVHKIRIEAFASIEGDSSFNVGLQEQRAEVYRKLFAQAQEEEIRLEVETSEAWEQFFEQIEDTQLDSLRQYSHAEIKDFLKDPVFFQELEPLLAKQRRASLIIYLEAKTGPASLRQSLEKAYIDRMIPFQESRSMKDEAKLLRMPPIMGVRKLMIEMEVQGKISPGLYIHTTRFENSVEGLAAIYELKTYYDQISQLSGFDLEHRVRELHSIWLNKAKNIPNTNSFYPFVLYCGLDLMDFIFERIISGELDISILCDIGYPRTQPYRYMRFHEWDFIDYAERNGLKSPNCMDIWLQKAYNVTAEELVEINDRWKDRSGPYQKEIYSLKKRMIFYYLNDLLLGGFQGYPEPEMYEFDLAYLLDTYHLAGWIPEDNHVYERNDGYRNIIARMVVDLNKYRNRLCGEDFYQILLDFHSRNTLYNYSDADEGKMGQAMITPEESRNYLIQYATSTIREQEADELLELSSHLLFFDREKSGHHALKEGYKLIKNAFLIGKYNENTISFVKNYGPVIDHDWEENQAVFIEISGQEEWQQAPAWRDYIKEGFLTQVKKTQPSKTAPSLPQIFSYPTWNPDDLEEASVEELDEDGE